MSEINTVEDLYSMLDRYTEGVDWDTFYTLRDKPAPFLKFNTVPDKCVVDFISGHTQADGIISTKPALIKRGKELRLFTILRVFILDSMAFENIQKQMAVARPDMLEILPGLMPKIITRVSRTVKVPVIAGGLISEKEDVMAALAAGAISVSTTNPRVWEM